MTASRKRLSLHNINTIINYQGNVSKDTKSVDEEFFDQLTDL